MAKSFFFQDELNLNGTIITGIADEDDMSSDSATLIPTQQSVKAYVDSQSGGVTVTDSTANTNFPVVFHNESNGLLDDTGAFRYNPSSGLVLAPSLAIDGTTVTTTAAELNLIDGGTARGTTAVASGDGILINDGGTMRMTNVDTVSTYFASHSVGGSNIVTTGALNSGSITSGFGAIDNGSSAITTTGTITFGSLSDAVITVTAFVDEDNMTSDSATLIPTQQSVKAYVDTGSHFFSSTTPSGLAGTGSIANTFVNKIGGEYVTTINVDLTGLTLDSVGSSSVIAKNGETSNTSIHRITDATNGIIYKAEVFCVELPSKISEFTDTKLQFAISDTADINQGADITESDAGNHGFLVGNSFNNSFTTLNSSSSATSWNYYRFGSTMSTSSTTASTSSNSTSVTLSSSNSSIKVGMTVTGTGIVGGVYVAAISGTSLTLTSNQSIFSGTTLSFSGATLSNKYIYIGANDSQSSHTFTTGKFLIKLYGTNF